MASNRKHSGYGVMIVITLLILFIATFILVVVGKKLLNHEQAQSDRIAVLEQQKEELNNELAQRDVTIESLSEALADTTEKVSALEDIYSLAAGKLTALEEWKADTEQKIAKGELVTPSSTTSSSSASDEDPSSTSASTSADPASASTADPDPEEVTDPEPESNSKGFYQKLVNGENVNLLIVGDSIGEPMDDASWVKLLQNWIANTYKVTCNVTNVSMAGNTSYAGYVRTMMLPDTMSYDLAIICYGHNDVTYGFAEKYELIIRAVQAKFPNCAMISILQSSQREYTEKIQKIQEMCAYYNIPTADTIAAFNDSGIAYDELTDDGVHPNAAGKRFYFETLRNVIKPKVEANETYTYAERSPKECVWNNYNKFTFYDASSFERTDDVTFELTGVKINGVIGIYWEMVPGDGGYYIYTDDKVYADMHRNWTFDYIAPYIYQASGEWCKTTNSLKVVFTNKQEADLFHGIAYSR